MKRKFALFTLIAFLFIGFSTLYAQDSNTDQDTEQVENSSDEKDIQRIIKQKFMEGGPEFMGIVLLCLMLLSQFV